MICVANPRYTEGEQIMQQIADDHRSVQKRVSTEGLGNEEEHNWNRRSQRSESR
jgi:hypothetical protein